MANTVSPSTTTSPSARRGTAHLSPRTLVNIGVFTAIYFVITYATGLLGFFNPFMYVRGMGGGDPPQRHGRHALPGPYADLRGPDHPQHDRRAPDVPHGTRLVHGPRRHPRRPPRRPRRQQRPLPVPVAQCHRLRHCAALARLPPPPDLLPVRNLLREHRVQHGPGVRGRHEGPLHPRGHRRVGPRHPHRRPSWADGSGRASSTATSRGPASPDARDPFHLPSPSRPRAHPRHPRGRGARGAGELPRRHTPTRAPARRLLLCPAARPCARGCCASTLARSS